MLARTFRLLLQSPSTPCENWARSPMDRTMVSEAVGTGSIPVGPTFYDDPLFEDFPVMCSLHFSKSC
jgi:hypothetical protein